MSKVRIRPLVDAQATWVAGGCGATGVRATFAARRSERYLGFGERSNAVDQRGREVENYVAEGPFEEDERAVVPAFVPAWGFHPRDDATYFPMPWLLSTAGYGVLVDIASALSHGLSHFDAGRRVEALWWWQFSYLSHWGERAAAALRVVQGLLAHVRLDADPDAVAEAEFDALHP